MQEALREALRRILGDPKISRSRVEEIKLEVASEFHLGRVPSNSELLEVASDPERGRVAPLLRVKPTRSLSGVVVLTVQTPPSSCPHGRCIFCPGGPEWGTPMSYTGKEPASRRALRHRFDPYAQSSSRLLELSRAGHPVEKVEVVIQGGTFLSGSPPQLRAFVQRIFDALNDFGSPTPLPSESLEEAQKRNETARSRVVALTIETKPDWARKEDLDLALELGATRIELGLQTLDEKILQRTNRGHTLEDSIEACGRVKDWGFKFTAHVMPGLPGSDFERDLETFRRLFSDPEFRPDALKIYPTLVIPGTPLYHLWKKGAYTPPSEEEIVRLLSEVKSKILPPWVRIQRIDRDIPSTEIAAGVFHLNLRQLVHRELEQRGERCRCIRCREAGRREGGSLERVTLKVQSYESSGGREHFLSLEDPTADVLFAYARLREPGERLSRAELEGSAILRELRVVGGEVPLHKRPWGGEVQHRGLGSYLLSQCESWARGLGYSGLTVTSGVGVREYYFRRGYRRAGAYVRKEL